MKANKTFTNFPEMMEMVTNIQNNTTFSKHIINQVKLSCLNDNNTSPFFFKINNERFPTRDAAVGDMIKRTMGNAALSHVTKQDMVTLVNIAGRHIPSSEQTTIVSLDGNVIAALSDDYRPISAKEVFEQADSAITNFEGDFVRGYIDIDYFSASWALKSEKIREAYKDVITEDIFSPILTIETSNTGMSAVNILPKFCARGVEFIIGKPLSVLHKGNVSIEDVKSNMHQIYGLFKKSAETFNKLMNIKISYPINCFKNVSKAIGLPKKYALNALQDFESYIDDEDEVTAYDIYIGIVECVRYARADERKKRSERDIQELCARALSIDWHKFDTSVSEWNVSTKAE